MEKKKPEIRRGDDKIKAIDVFNILLDYLDQPDMDYDLALMTLNPMRGASFIDIAGICGGMSGKQKILLFRPSIPVTQYPRRMLDVNPVILLATKNGKSVYGCPSCLTPISQVDKFCRYCGTKLLNDASTQEPCNLCNKPLFKNLTARKKKTKRKI